MIAARASVTGTAGDATGAAGAGMIPAGEAGAGEAGTAAGVAGAAVTAAGGGPDWVAGSPRPCRSAAANSSQLANRSAGALASALASTASTAAGRPGRRDRSEGGGCDRCARIIASPGTRIQRLAAQQLERRAGERVLIGPAVDGLALDLLRRGVVQRADELPGSGVHDAPRQRPC